MKTFLLVLALVTLSTTAYAQEDVGGYVRSNGQFVMPYGRREPLPDYPQPVQVPSPDVPNQNVDIVPTQPVQMMVPGIGLPPVPQFTPFGQ